MNQQLIGSTVETRQKNRPSVSRAGDTVVAKDEETGEIAVKQVVRTFENSTEELTHVTIRTESGTLETIDTTPQHPFYVEGKGWVEASALHIGMTVWLADGTKATVEDVSSETLDEAIAVYNFEVEDFHTYFVGHSGVWVHNDCRNPNGRNGGSEHQEVIADIKDQIKEQGLRPSTEYYVPANTGQTSLQGSRFVDVAELSADGQPIAFHQVGRTTQSGLPVMRESRAIEDIIERTGIPVIFHSYTDQNMPPIVYD